MGRVRSRSGNTITLTPVPERGLVAPKKPINYARVQKPVLDEQVLHAQWVGPQPVDAESAPDISDGPQVSKYKILAKNAVITAALETQRDMVFWPGYSIQPRNDYKRYPGFEALDRAVIEFLESELSNLKKHCGKDLDTILNIVFDDARVCGFTVSEVMFADPARYRNIHLLDVRTKTPTDIRFDVDINRALCQLWYLPLALPVPEPWISSKFAVGTWPYLKDGYYYGVSDLQSVESDVALMMLYDYSFGTIAQRTANATILHYFIGEDRDPAELAAAREAALNITKAEVLSLKALLNPDTGALIKNDIFEQLDASKLINGESLKALFEAYKEALKRVQRRFGMPDDLGMSGSVTGSNARAKTEFNITTARAFRGQQWLEAFVNSQILNKLVRFNFPYCPPAYNYPEFTFGTQEEEWDETVAKTVADLVKAGILTREEGRERLGYTPVPLVGELSNAQPAPDSAQPARTPAAVR